MKIIGLMAARNEDWVIGLSARAALMWVDELVVLDHASTDRTPRILNDILECYPGRLTILREESPVWEEMRHRQRMLEEARARNATHIAYVDADEVLTGDLLGLDGTNSIRSLYHGCPPQCVLQIPWLALRGSIGQVHISGPWADGQNASIGFMDAPELHWAARGSEKYDFHHRHPMGRALVPWTPLGAMGPRRSGLMHLQFVSGRRLRAKQALYKVQEVLRWPGREPVEMVNQRYSLAVYGSYRPDAGWQQRLDASMDGAPITPWWEPYQRLMQYFRPHAVPWQEAEVLKALQEHGPKPFVGLDLFGIGEPAFHEHG